MHQDLHQTGFAWERTRGNHDWLQTFHRWKSFKSNGTFFVHSCLSALFHSEIFKQPGSQGLGNLHQTWANHDLFQLKPRWGRHLSAGKLLQLHRVWKAGSTWLNMASCCHHDSEFIFRTIDGTVPSNKTYFVYIFTTCKILYNNK